MAAAPVITAGISAIGTVAGMAQQSRTASAQRAAIQAQNITARDQAALMQDRLEAAERTAEQMYLRDRVVLDRQRDTAQLSLSQLKVQQEMELRQQGLQIDQADAAADIQIQELLATAAQGQTQTSLQNIERFRTLAEVLTGNRDQANEIVRMAAMSELSGGTFDRLQAETRLQDIEALQATDEAVDTANRVSTANTENLQTQADIMGRTQNVLSDLYRAQLNRQAELNQFSNERLPGILNLQYERQLAALEANRFAQAGSLQLQQQANQVNLQNTLATNQARMAGIQGPSILGGLLNIGGSIFNAIQQSQPATIELPRQQMPPTMFSGFVPNNRA